MDEHMDEAAVQREPWNQATNACDGCGVFVAWSTDTITSSLYFDEDRTMNGRAALALPGRPHSRACPRYAHRWYLCTECPEMDLCGACAVKHEHPCYEGPLHDASDTCALCITDINKLSEYQEGWSRPSAPPRPHPDHPSSDPPLYVDYFTHVNPGPHYDSMDDGDNTESDDDYAYSVYYPGPYKDANGRQRRFVRTSSL